MLTKELEKKIEIALQQLCYPSLLKGDMGVCVYYFMMGKMRNDATLILKGEKALEKIMSQMNRYKKLSIEEGITGVGLGISFLLRNNYIEGDINEALQDIDTYAYKGIEIILENETHIDTKLPTLDVLIYFVERYVDVDNQVRKMFYQKLVVRLFNHIYINRPDSFYQESFPFSLKKESYLFMAVLVRIYKLGIEKERIHRIFNEMKPFLFSNFPLLHANRLHLLTAVYMVGKCINDSEWIGFADRLSQGMSLRHILNEELADKNILLLSGVIGIWLLMEVNKRQGLALKSDMGRDDLRDRILKSTIWNRIEIDGEYLCNCYSLDGYCGAKLLLEYLGKEKENEV